jgi:ribosomal protein S27AE
MSERGKMVCPDCGVEMNRHAEKVDYTAEPPEADAFDPDFGGVLEEFHTCPRCGRTLSRHAG